MFHRTLSLPPHATSPRRARRFVEGSLSAASAGEAAGTAALLVSELVTNAVLHAGTGVEVDVRVDRQRVCVRVSDGATAAEAPQARPRRRMAAVGRGTQLLEQLADEWGAHPRSDGGKTVWFELCASDGALFEHPASVPTSPGSPSGDLDDHVAVTFVDVPVGLAGRALDHHEELLRELKLASLTDGHERRLPPRLLELAGRVRDRFVPLIHPLRAGIAAAAEGGEAVCRVTVTVPAALRQATVDVAAVHAEADSLSRQGLLLTLPPGEDVVRFRCWLLGQLTAQIGGAEPAPYRTPARSAR